MIVTTGAAPCESDLVYSMGQTDSQTDESVMNAASAIKVDSLTCI